MSYLLLVVEDEEQLRKMICEHFTSEGYTTIEAGNGEEALVLWKQQHPDLVILDIMLPARSGMEVLKEIRMVDSTPVIMLTARVEEIDKLLGLEMGADDYITKPFSPRELSARVKAVMRRSNSSPSDRHVLSLGSLKVDIHRMEAYSNGHLISLTGTEFRILLIFIENPGQVFSRLQILERIYGDIYEGYERTIDTHINNLRRKMEAAYVNDTVIKTVYGVGYKLIEEGK
ncbi:dna-binding response regulator [hydrocarbon metagenome]|uniref:Dna-binding response regulator n=1 Tax=hydrocarbon metagenome TaxID=938273 RepID=A0A0W8E2B1_9ZZZZ